MKKETKAEANKPSAEFQAFDTGLRRALAVPKEEIDRREKQWREKQEARKKSRSKEP